LYIEENEPMPCVNEYSVILNSKDEAVCIIQTTKVKVVPFDQVSADHAYKEGEGDKSLDYWRTVHKDFFTAELAAVGIGMCCTMVWADEYFVPGIVIGVIGLAGAVSALPLYNHITATREHSLHRRLCV
jgi:hypothetical protein